jgi:phage protein D
MAEENVLISEIYIKLNGQELQKPVMVHLIEVVVDQHCHLPGMFTIRLHDPEMKLLDEGPFDLTKEIEIAAQKPGAGKVVLMQGEITALEPSFQEGMIVQLIVRGYDKSHRLYRETRSRTFLNKKDSDIAGEMAQAAGLQADIETTSTVYDHIYQHNQSDLVFLMERAWRIGFECFVDNGKLTFRKPSTTAAAVNLKWGDDLLSFSPRMTLAEQVNEVLVKDWDVEKQETITGKAKKGRLYPRIGDKKDGAAWAGDGFGQGRLVVVDQPVVSQAEADTLAAARLDEISGAFVQAEGLAFRRPDIRAGQIVKLERLGKRFSGDYLVTSATHSHTPEGLHTIFTVRGTRTGLLAEQVMQKRPLRRWPGGVLGVVTNTDDPRNWGRIKVKFPWMSNEDETDWARVVSSGAGPDAGLFVIPGVGDEVLVIFEHGDFSRPLVLGGMWNGKHKVPEETTKAGSGERPLVRSWCSRKGHRVTLLDTADNKLEIVTAGGHQIVLDDNKKKIEVLSAGGLKITMDDNDKKIQVESSKDVVVKAGANMTLEAGANLDIKANGQVNVQGQMVNLN